MRPLHCVPYGAGQAVWLPFAVLFAVLMGVCGPGQHKTAAASQVKVAVLEFDAVNQPAKAGGWGRAVSEMLTTAAVNSGAFAVAERHLMQKVMSEQMMGDRDKDYVSSAQSIGNMVGADYILSGSVTKVDSQLRIDARLVDVATGAVISAQDLVARADLAQLSKKIKDLMADMVESVYGGAPPQVSQPAESAPAALAEPFVLKVKLAAPAGVDLLLKEGDTLTSADGYFLELATARKLYVYVGQIDASGSLYALFPNPAFSAAGNPLEPGALVRVPGQENFHLDDTTGTETIMALASPGPVPEVERVFERLDTADPFAMEDLARQFQDTVQGGVSGHVTVIRLNHE